MPKTGAQKSATPSAGTSVAFVDALGQIKQAVESLKALAKPGDTALSFQERNADAIAQLQALIENNFRPYVRSRRYSKSRVEMAPAGDEALLEAVNLLKNIVAPVYRDYQIALPEVVERLDEQLSVMRRQIMTRQEQARAPTVSQTPKQTSFTDSLKLLSVLVAANLTETERQAFLQQEVRYQAKINGQTNPSPRQYSYFKSTKNIHFCWTINTQRKIFEKTAHKGKIHQRRKFKGFVQHFY
jgi:hypothetical protein